jgi:hypothetical protein
MLMFTAESTSRLMHAHGMHTHTVYTYVEHTHIAHAHIMHIHAVHAAVYSIFPVRNNRDMPTAVVVPQLVFLWAKETGT